MSIGHAICEEFSEEVFRLHHYNIQNPKLSYESEELKCSLDIEYFTALVERMVEVGYCCTQVQKDLVENKCIAWFEPVASEESV